MVQDLNALDAERLEIEKRQQGTVALQEKQKELESKGPSINDVYTIFSLFDPPPVTTSFTQPFFLWSEFDYAPSLLSTDVIYECLIR